MAIANSSKIRKVADSIGIIGSATCAAHCLLLPALLVAGTTLPSVLVSEHAFHLLLAIVVIPSAVIAFFIGCRKHRDKWVFTLGASGLIAMTTIALAGHDLLGHDWERILMVAASFLLVSAHFRNYTLCRQSICLHANQTSE